MLLYQSLCNAALSLTMTRTLSTVHNMVLVLVLVHNMAYSCITQMQCNVYQVPIEVDITLTAEFANSVDKALLPQPAAVTVIFL